MAFFDCQIIQSGGSGTVISVIVNCDAAFSGMNITATDGTTTLSELCPATSPYSVQFDLPNSGTWTISGTVSGDTSSTTVIIPDSATLLPPIPTGSTVTPVNDIQIWLHCADIWDKAYTTISQVLSDASTLQALIASNNAADYMARSTSWANSVTANSNAMTYIGANNYCADKLLADSTWLNTICNSTYFESVLNVKVPTMTSATAPSGEVIASDTSAGQPYYVFNPSTSNNWNSGNSSSGYFPKYIGYIFPNNTNVKKFLLGVNRNDGYAVKTAKIQYSSDGSTWYDSGNTITNQYRDGTVVAYNIEDTTSHKVRYWRLALLTNYNDLAYDMIVTTLQFYGRA